MNISDIFSSVQSPDYPISQFNGDHSCKTTLSIGSLTPIKCIKYHPGDKFKMHSTTNVECPPLLSPSFQTYKLKEYLFKVRKGLTWKNDEYGKFVSSLYDGSVSPVMPFVRHDIYYSFGSAVVRIKFDPKLPVYGFIHVDGSGQKHIEFQTSNFPTGSFNDYFLNFASLSSNDIQRLISLLKDSFSYEVVYENKREFVDPTQVNYTGVDSILLRPAFTRTCWKCPSPLVDGSQLEPLVDIATAPVRTFNSTTFAELGDPHMTHVGQFIDRVPFYRPSELLEALGYPAQIIDAENIDYIKIFKKNMEHWLDSVAGGDLNALLPELYFYENTDFFGTCDTGYGDYYPDPSYFTLIPITNLRQRGHTLHITTLLQAYAEFMIANGHGDGTPMDVDNMMSIQDIKLSDIMLPPCRKDKSAFVYDLGPLTSFWLIWNEYFRDASLSKEVGLLRDSGMYLNSYVTPVTTDRFDPSTFVYTTINGYEVDYDLPIDFGSPKMPSIRKTLMESEAYRDYTAIPQKCIDRNYFTSALPDISKVQVFAPVVPSLPSNGVVPSMTAPVDYKPTQNVDPSTTFMSIDAFRTANVLESFFVNSMLAGPRPVSLILMHFGEHSKDFRMEIPELIDASEATFSNRELTQQSETEQLPLGFQVSQMSIVKGLNEGSQFIDSDGDHGYLIRLVCLYPEIFEVGGVNKELFSDSPFDWMYFPAFGILGEQAIEQAELNVQPVDISSGSVEVDDARDNYQTYAPLCFESEFGYTARYGHLKRIPSEVHGRFLRDLRYWTLDRIQQPLSYDGSSTTPPVLRNSMQFLAIPKDTRMFVSSDQDNFKLYQFVDCQMTRKLPMINSVKLL